MTRGRSEATEKCIIMYGKYVTFFINIVCKQKEKPLFWEKAGNGSLLLKRSKRIVSPAL
jgi:hypothetical protein